MWNKANDLIKTNKVVTTPSKFFVVNDLKGAPIYPDDLQQPGAQGSMLRSSDAKIKNQIRLAMEVIMV